MNNSDRIISACKAIRGVTFANVDTLTEVKLSGGKSNPHLGKVFKLSKGIPVILAKTPNEQGSPAYEMAVNRRLKEEGKEASFVSQGLAAHYEPVEFPVIRHIDKGTMYLMATYTGKAREVSYLLDGQPIAKEDIIGYPKPSAKTGQGGLENQVQIRTPKLESIVELRALKEVF